MYFQRLEDLRIDHDKTQQEIADLLFASGKFTGGMKRVREKFRSGR